MPELQQVAFRIGLVSMPFRQELNMTRRTRDDWTGGRAPGWASARTTRVGPRQADGQKQGKDLGEERTITHSRNCPSRKCPHPDEEVNDALDHSILLWVTGGRL